MKILLLFLFSVPAFATYMPNTVGSSLTNVRLEFATIANSGTCSITSQSGAFSGITSPAGGTCQLSVISNTFSSNPTCLCAALAGSADKACGVNTSSTSAVETYTYTANTGVAANLGVFVICAGQK